MQVPILKQGAYLIATVQSALTDLKHLRDTLVVLAARRPGSGSQASRCWFWPSSSPRMARLAVASVDVFVRDLERLMALFIQVLFFLTPVIYSVSVVPVQYRIWIKLNTVAPLIRGWQKLLLDNHLDPLLVEAAYLSALSCLVFGALIYRALSPRFAELV